MELGHGDRPHLMRRPCWPLGAARGRPVTGRCGSHGGTDRPDRSHPVEHQSDKPGGTPVGDRPITEGPATFSQASAGG
eukprot:870752-Alexandrium_andersonii.AAC.1